MSTMFVLRGRTYSDKLCLKNMFLKPTLSKQHSRKYNHWVLYRHNCFVYSLQPDAKRNILGGRCFRCHSRHYSRSRGDGHTSVSITAASRGASYTSGDLASRISWQFLGITRGSRSKQRCMFHSNETCTPARLHSDMQEIMQVITLAHQNRVYKIHRHVIIILRRGTTSTTMQELHLKLFQTVAVIPPCLPFLMQPDLQHKTVI